MRQLRAVRACVTAVLCLSLVVGAVPSPAFAVLSESAPPVPAAQAYRAALTVAPLAPLAPFSAIAPVQGITPLAAIAPVAGITPVAALTPASPLAPAAPLLPATREALIAAARQLLPAAQATDPLSASWLQSKWFDGLGFGASFGTAGDGAPPALPPGGSGSSSNGGGNGGSRAGWFPSEAGVIVLNEFVPFPGRKLRFMTGNKADTRLLITASQGANGGFVLFVSPDRDGTAQSHAKVASLARVIGNVRKDEDGNFHVQVEIVAEATITGYRPTGDGVMAKLEHKALGRGEPGVESYALAAAKDAFARLAAENSDLPAKFVTAAAALTDPVAFANNVAQELPWPLATKQSLLAAPTLTARLELLTQSMTDWRIEIAVHNKLTGQTGTPAQAEDDDDGEDGKLAEKLKERVLKSTMPAEARSLALRELKKLASMQPNNSDYAVTANHIRWLLEVPWTQKTEDRIDLKKGREVLDRDHSGLEKVKKRILEYLAVRKKSGSLKGPILCFVGPPGTGKTSIAKDIAEAVGRKFVRMPVGGVHNEAEIRGHRRTYVGAIPGKIISLIKRAGVVNPVFLIDEIDKLATGAQVNGDPSAALLEALDPEQNHAFNDHYLDTPYDLSQVLFITTANSLEDIPGPLRDRMEIIEFSSYTTGEKVSIASDHAVDEKLVEAGYRKGQIKFRPEALTRLIEGHTRESGVRELRRKIEEVLRKLVWRESEGKTAPSEVTAELVDELLGNAPYDARGAMPNEVGVATGLAVSGHGGSTLNITVLAVPGTGKIHLRKQMREMMDDSVHNAHAFVQSAAASLGIAYKAFKSVDLHVAIAPAGPVDGPSAGAALSTAIASRLSGRPVKKGVAMTGTITLNGRVQAIGGLKEKVLAAHRSGMTTVLYPAENQKDIDEIPDEVKRAVRLVPVSTAAEVFAEALEPAPFTIKPLGFVAWLHRVAAAVRNW